MQKKSISVWITLSLALSAALPAVSTACARASELTLLYGKDAPYFEAKQCLVNQDSHKAASLFAKAAKNGSPLVSRLSLEELCRYGSKKQKLSAAQTLYKQFADMESLATACSTLYENDAFDKVLSLTDSCPAGHVSDQSTMYRLLSMAKIQDQRFSDLSLDWFLENPFSTSHNQFAQALSDSSEHPLSIMQKFRTSVYNRNYGAVLQTAKNLCRTPENLSPQLLSDIGKTLLYGSNEYQQNADLLLSICPSLTPACQFYAYFYAGRLSDQTSTFKSPDYFQKAMQLASTDQLYDNALWYYLNACLKDSIASALTELDTYRSKWHDPSYFDDFLDTLSLRLINKHMWSEYYATAKKLNGFASPEATAKFSYVSALLIETKRLTPKDISSVEACISLYNLAADTSTSLYYRFLAAQKLQMDSAALEEKLSVLCTDRNFKRNEEAERILKGFADYSMPQEIYPFWQRFNSVLGIESIKNAALYLQQTADAGQEQYYYQSLRIAAKKANFSEAPVDLKLMELAFPRDYQNFVQDECWKNDLNEYLLYALIRSESFFDSQIASHAGAVGLTQLMEGTAGDVAKKLKIEDYDLRDSATNIAFGANYLAEMIRRLDDNQMHAIFAYNGGITRVRSWIKSSRLEFGTDNLNDALFLEALPFAETREYGRKVVSAAAMYGMLYYSKSPDQIIAEIMK